jgi:hypothetical protein
MRSTLLTSLLVLAIFCSYGQSSSEDIIELGRYYSNFMFMNDAPKSTQKSLGKSYDEDLSLSVRFVKEATKTKNKILTDKFLELPDTTTLRVLYIVDALHQNPHLKNPLEPKDLVDSLWAKSIPYHELVDEYYSLVFTSVGNKNKPFNMSKVNFDLEAYGLNSPILKGIFYLRCMNVCGKEIFGYMNIVRPPNTEKALSYIENFPKFNDLLYYQFTDLTFKDFEMEIFNDKGQESYKDHFMNELYSTLVNHLICLTSEGRSEEEVRGLLLGSILKDSMYYKHTEYKDFLESIFEKQ